MEDLPGVPRLALTYDDGPSIWTPSILDTLKAHGARATFFVCGTHILGRIPIIDRITDEGHELGNHTTTHPDLSTLSDDEVRRELAETAAMLHAITGRVPRVWRAPYLHLPVFEQPFLHVGCDIIPEDWRETDPNVIAQRVLDQVAEDDVILLHDGRPPGQPDFADGGSLNTREATVQATSILVPALIGRGFDLVTVSELYDSLGLLAA